MDVKLGNEVEHLETVPAQEVKGIAYNEPNLVSKLAKDRKDACSYIKQCDNKSYGTAQQQSQRTLRNFLKFEYVEVPAVNVFQHLPHGNLFTISDRNRTEICQPISMS